jgi:hypothetical protein
VYAAFTCDKFGCVISRSAGTGIGTDTATDTGVGAANRRRCCSSLALTIGVVTDTGTIAVVILATAATVVGVVNAVFPVRFCKNLNFGFALFTVPTVSLPVPGPAAVVAVIEERTAPAAPVVRCDRSKRSVSVRSNFAKNLITRDTPHHSLFGTVQTVRERAIVIVAAYSIFFISQTVKEALNNSNRRPRHGTINTCLEQSKRTKQMRYIHFQIFD